MNNSSHISKKWLKNLSMRVNLLDMDVPYVPLLLKDISTYFQSNDHIKTIQTIGHIQTKGNIIQIVDAEAKGVSLPVCLDQLPITEIYFQVPRDNCNNIWEYNAVRVYGTLVKRESQIVLNIVQLFELKHIHLCRKVFNVLSTRKGCHQYSNDEVDKLFDEQWEKMECL